MFWDEFLIASGGTLREFQQAGRPLCLLTKPATALYLMAVAPPAKEYPGCHLKGTGLTMTTHQESTGTNGFRAARSVQRLAAISEEDEVFSSLARILKRRVKSSWIVVYLLDRNGHGFAPPRSYGLPDKLEPEFRKIPLLPGREAQLRLLLDRKRHILLPDPSSSDMLAPAFRDKMAPFTLLAVPMRVQQQIQGVVLLARPRRLPLFTAAELATVRELVLQSSLV